MNFIAPKVYWQYDQRNDRLSDGRVEKECIERKSLLNEHIAEFDIHQVITQMTN